MCLVRFQPTTLLGWYHMDTRHMPKNAVWWDFCIISACRLFSGVSTALQFSKFIIWQVAAKACLHYSDNVSQSNPRPYHFKNRPRVCGAFLGELKLVQHLYLVWLLKFRLWEWNGYFQPWFVLATVFIHEGCTKLCQHICWNEAGTALSFGKSILMVRKEQGDSRIIENDSVPHWSHDHT